MRRFSFLLIFALAAALQAQQKPATTVQLPPKPLLPQSFGIWTSAEVPQETINPPTLQASVLTEFGFKRAATGTYFRKAAPKDAAVVLVQAEQFSDATGAFGAFSNFGCDAPCKDHSVKIGAGGVGSDMYVAFWIGDTFVRVERKGLPLLPSNDDLSALAKELPIPFGSKAQAPILPNYLPSKDLNKASVRYALGPATFASVGSPLANIDFNTGAEVVVASYKNGGTLTLVEYPTPQMAAAQLKTIAASLQLTPQHDDLFTGANMAAERSGPIVALASGLPQAQAIKLAGQVHYEAEITWNHPEGYVSDAWRAAHLYLGIFALAGILCAASVILGLFFGGARALSRVLRGKSASAVEDTEFISLDLGTGGELRKLDTPPATPKD